MASTPGKEETSGDVVKNTDTSWAMGGIAGGIGALADMTTNMINNISASDVKAKKKELITQTNSAQMKGQAANDSFDTLANDMATTAMLSKVDKYDLGAKKGVAIGTEAFTEGLKGSMAGFNAGNAIQGMTGGSKAYGGHLMTMNNKNKYMGGGPIGAIVGGVLGTGMSLVGNLVRNHKAKKAAQEVNEQIAYTNDFNDRSMMNRAENLTSSQLMGLEAAYAALGGPLANWDGAIGYQFMQDYLNSKRLQAEGQDEETQALPTTSSMNVLRAFGGNLGVHGGDFTNGLTFIDEGGSHESNPYEGVPMGVDQEGTPNLVEEGETIYNDYVFSKRLKVPQAIRNKYKMRGTKNLSFAEASKKMAKESEERPNDPISQRGLEALLSDLAMSQEMLKAERSSRQYANGGKKFDIGGNKSVKGSYSESDAWGELMYPQLMAKLDNALSLNGDARENAINDLIDMTDNTQNSYHSNVYGKSTWGAPTYTAGGGSHQELWGNYGLNNYDKDAYGRVFNDRARSGDKWDNFGVDNKIGNHTILRNLGLNTYSSDKIDAIRQKAAQLGLTYNTLEGGNPELYFRRMPADTGEVAPVIEPVQGQEDPVVPTAAPEIVADVEGEEEAKVIDPLYLGRNPNEWMRFAPAVGFGIGAITDMLGLTNKPDYSNADLVINATRGAITPRVGFKPIGNYLARQPLDREFYINQLNAQSGAGRRSILQNAGLNRGTGMAALLAADNNAQNQLGLFARQAEEYNREDRHKVEDFNRATNMFNSEGFLKADMANQSAAQAGRDFALRGTIAAAEMRERARNAADAARSANLSGLFQTIGDIGYEAKNDNMLRRAIEAGVYGPGAQRVYRDDEIRAMEKAKRAEEKALKKIQRETAKKEKNLQKGIDKLTKDWSDDDWDLFEKMGYALGGKMKKRKGLTF